MSRVEDGVRRSAGVKEVARWWKRMAVPRNGWGEAVDKTRFSLVAIHAEAPAEQRVLARLPRMPGLPSVTCSFCSSRRVFKFNFFSVSFGQGRFITRHETATYLRLFPVWYTWHFVYIWHLSC